MLVKTNFFIINVMNISFNGMLSVMIKALDKRNKAGLPIKINHHNKKPILPLLKNRFFNY